MNIIFIFFFIILSTFIFLRSVFSAVLMLILVFFFIATYLLILNVDFIAIIILIVYIGGICVLFLSAIFILNYHDSKKLKETKLKLYFFFSFFSLLFFSLNILRFPNVNFNLLNLTQLKTNTNSNIPYNFIVYIISNQTVFYLLTLLLLLGVVFVILITSKNNIKFL